MNPLEVRENLEMSNSIESRSFTRIQSGQSQADNASDIAVNICETFDTIHQSLLEAGQGAKVELDPTPLANSSDVASELNPLAGVVERSNTAPFDIRNYPSKFASETSQTTGAEIIIAWVDKSQVIFAGNSRDTEARAGLLESSSDVRDLEKLIVESAAEIRQDSPQQTIGQARTPSAILASLEQKHHCMIATHAVKGTAIPGGFVVVAFLSKDFASGECARVVAQLSSQLNDALSMLESWWLCREGERAFGKRQRMGRLLTSKLIWGACVICMLSMALPFPYRPKRTCTIEPAFRNFVTAPADGVLKETYFRPGDRVEQGDLLAKLDEEHLQNEIASSEAQLATANKKRDVALAARSGGELRIAQHEQQIAKLKIEHLKSLLSKTEIIAPASGIIVHGDWDGAEGMPFERGQTLFELSPLDRYLAKIQLQPDDLDRVAIGTEVVLASTSLLSDKISGEISRIDPIASTSKEHCFFEAEVELAPNSQLRPGLELSATLRMGNRLLVWQLFQKPMLWLKNSMVW